ncbi:DNA-processing protein DprA [Prauserella sp. PE36]|uniref:DNA-processing protein DprA n=1 Tax=Prauserella sp. PE36 TaxID=1504709 RepID=UPI0013141263|nr:DNA-processing protein DprA [Prauserella sp. PE36]
MRATEPPTRFVGANTAVHDPVDAAARIRAGCAPPPGLAEVAQPEPDLRDDLAALEAGHARLLTPEDDDWPNAAAHDLAASGTGAPLGLWVHGDPQLGVLTAGRVAVVGSLAASPYGEYVAAELARGVADRDIAVVNGAEARPPRLRGPRTGHVGDVRRDQRVAAYRDGHGRHLRRRGHRHPWTPMTRGTRWTRSAGVSRDQESLVTTRPC